jgi:threonine synthase
MKFYSTRGKAPEVDFKTALFQGLAPDGGLYMPRNIPQFTHKELDEILSLDQAAFAVLRKWLSAEEISDKDLQKIVSGAFTYPIPLNKVGNLFILELFHGPTMAFKDIAAGVLAQLFDYFLAKEHRNSTILVATSGDTGGAIAQAFSGMRQVKVVVLYPKGKVSELQKEQLIRVGENIIAIEVNGAFDDCQAFVKKAFQDTDLKKFNLSSANSINIGRLIPQIIYYVYASRMLGLAPVRFVIPSGNMGNATAAILALKMGLPIDSLVIATNENDVAVKYYKTGVFKNKKSLQTLSTAMDIGKPSNFERILELFQYDHTKFRKIITAVKVSDKKTVVTIKKVLQKEKYLMDFHTAVGYYTVEKLGVSDPSVVATVVSTASPLKFAKEMEKETGITVDNSDILKNLRTKTKRVIRSSNDYTSLKKLLIKQVS